MVLAGYVDDQLRTAVTAAGAAAVLDTANSIEHLVEVLRTGNVRSADPLALPDRDGRALALAKQARITPRQYDVLRSLATGGTTDQIARSIGIKVSTCRDHIKALHRTLGCSTAAELIVTASRMGLLPELSRPHR